MKILVTPTSLKPGRKSPALDMLRAFADTVVFNPRTRPLVEDELIPPLEGCDGCIAGLDRFSKKVIESESARNLKVISRYGIGLDKVDLAAAKPKNIVVCNTPGASPLFALDNVVVTPHTASHTVEAAIVMASMAIRNLIDVLSGNACPYIVRVWKTG